MRLSLAALLVAAAASAAEKDDVLNALLRRLDEANGEAARLDVVREVAALKSPRAAPALSVELGSEANTDRVRLEALRGLEALNHEAGNDAIALVALKSDSAVVRARAVEAIGNLRIAEFAPACVKGLSADDGRVRRAAVEALVKFDSPALAGRVLPALQDDDNQVRVAAARGFFGFQVRRALRTLFPAAKAS